MDSTTLQFLAEENHWRYQSVSLHFGIYTQSSCSCLAQSRQTDAVLPSFPFPNSTTGAGAQANCPSLLLNFVISPDPVLNITIHDQIIHTGHCFTQKMLFLTSTDTLESSVQWLMRCFNVLKPVHFLLCRVLLSSLQTPSHTLPRTKINREPTRAKTSPVD